MPEIDPFNLMSRRTFLLGSSQVLLLSSLGIQLYRLQIKNQSRYEILSEKNRLAFRLLNAPRGRILDRRGVSLAVNKSNFRLIVLASNRQELENSLSKLKNLIDLSHLDFKGLLKEYKKHPYHLIPLVIKEPLTWQEVSILQVHYSDLTGVAVETGQARFYTLGEKAAHFLGYVGIPSKTDNLEKNLSSIPGFRIGKLGAEKILDLPLRGKEGSVSLEINAYRKVTREVESQPFSPGKDTRISLDARLQTYVAERLEPYESASAVVLNTQGEICALVSHPSFDPHLFVNGIRENSWKKIHDNPYKPLLNKALMGLYAPGSTIKMAIALAALEKNIIKPETNVYCSGVLTVNNHPFHCWMHKKGGHGTVNCRRAITQSCDVFFYEVAKRTGIENLISVMKTLGLGENLLPGFRESVSGLVPTPNWKKKNRRDRWTISDTMMTGIGQGYLLSTPLQLAVMAARLATGLKILPTYLHQATPLDAPRLPFSEDHLKLIRDSMAAVTGEPGGTGFSNRIIDPGLEMAGKTGTSQVRRISLQDRKKGLVKTDHRPWEEREHAVFCGYAPVHQPRFILALVVEHGGGGGPVATPIARDILKFAQTMG